MPSYIQIEGDPTRWLVPRPIHASQLTGPPLSLPVSAPVVGTLVLSGKSGSVVLFDAPAQGAQKDLDVPIPAIYVPTPSGISEGHVGYELPASADLDALASQISGSMHDGHTQTITLGGNASGGTLVLNGATLSFVVLCAQNPPAVGGATPHG
jgi:hypothetical protein